MAVLQFGHGLPAELAPLSPMLARAVLLIFFSAINIHLTNKFTIEEFNAKKTIQEKVQPRQSQTPRLPGFQMYL
jgi:hypothetical protein